MGYQCHRAAMRAAESLKYFKSIYIIDPLNEVKFDHPLCEWAGGFLYLGGRKHEENFYYCAAFHFRNPTAKTFRQMHIHTSNYRQIRKTAPHFANWTLRIAQ